MSGGEDILVKPGERVVKFYVGGRVTWRKLRGQRTVDLRFQFARTQIRGGNAKFPCGIGQGGNSMVGGVRDPQVREANLMTEEVEKVGEFTIERERHCGHLRRTGTDLRAENIVRRKTDGGPVCTPPGPG